VSKPTRSANVLLTHVGQFRQAQPQVMDSRLRELQRSGGFVLEFSRKSPWARAFSILR
jgi:hypothetical protein